MPEVKAKKPAEPTPEYKLDSFSWLPIERWNVDTLFNFYSVNGKKQCKVCDKWRSPAKEAVHIRVHIKEKKALTQARKELALEKARVEKEITKLLRQQEREAMKSLNLKREAR